MPKAISSRVKAALAGKAVALTAQEVREYMDAQRATVIRRMKKIGSCTSTAKAEAARKNGALGGRPKKKAGKK